MSIDESPFWQGVKKRLPTRDQITGTRLFRIFGNTILHRDLWRMAPNTVAGGVALGLFVGSTPTMGIQMIIVALLACIIRVNLPFGLACTWITNFFTAPFFYYSCYKLGLWIMGGAHNAPQVAGVGKLKYFFLVAKPLWLGSAVIGGVLAISGYFATLLLWSTLARYLFGKNRENTTSSSGLRLGPETESMSSVRRLTGSAHQSESSERKSARAAEKQG